MRYRVKTEVSTSHSWMGYGSEGRIINEGKKYQRPKEQKVSRLSEHLDELTDLINIWMGAFVNKWRDRDGTLGRWIEVRGETIVVIMKKDSSTRALDAWDMDNESWKKEELALTIKVNKRGNYQNIPQNLLQESVKYFKKQRKLRLG